MNRLKFLQCLYRRANGYIELRFLKSGRRAFISLGQDWGSVDKEITNQLSVNKNQDVYFGVATRDKKGGSLENIVSIPCAWTEIDFKDIPLTEARKCVNRLKIKPSCITHTGGGIHLYFFLDKSVPLKRGDDIRKVNEWLAWELGRGKLDNISDLPRILRLPDTHNLKYPDKPLCKIRLLKDDVRYTLDELLRMIPPEGTENGSSLTISAKKPIQELYANVEKGKRHDSMTRVVGAWIKSGVTEEECLMMANIANSQYKPPLPAEEILSIVQGIKAKDEKKKKVITEIEIFNPTDMGNAKRIAKKCKSVIRFVPEWKKWLVWNQVDGIWQVDKDGIVIRIVKALPSMIKDEIKHIVKIAKPINEDAQKAIEKKVNRYAHWKSVSEGARAISDAEKLLRTEPGVPLMAKILDTDKMIFNCVNGTVGLQDGAFLAHSKDNLITKIAGVTYDEKAECPKWLEFLGKIMGGDEDIIGFLKRSIGYSMTGDITERCIFLLHGVGSNGKSTFLNTIGLLMGDYGQGASFDSFVAKKYSTAINNDIARMQGKRFISAVESEAEKHFSESIIKQITGGDLVTARYLHAEFFDFKPQFKLWLAANHKPTITGTDNAIWTRIKLIPFDVIIPEFEQDKYLGNKLEKELAGILNWAIEGCVQWQKHGLKTPEGVSLATQDYREEMDVIGNYISERCIAEAMVSVSSQALFNDYKMWCEESRERPLTQNKFGRKMTERGFVIDRSTSKRFRKGIGLKEGGQGEVDF